MEELRPEIKEIQKYVDVFFNGNTSAAARNLDMLPDTLTKWLNGKRKNPPWDKLTSVLAKVRDAFDKKGMESNIIVFPSPEKQSIPLKVYSIAGAGPAWDYTEEEPICVVQIPEQFAFKATFAFLVKGDSMYPTIKNEAVVGVKTEEPFLNNEIYAIRLPYEGISIKRVQVNYKNEEYIIKSDNPDKTKFPDTIIPIETAPYLVLGKVVWIWQAC